MDVDDGTLDWRQRTDANSEPCYLSGFVERVQGRFLLHRSGSQWTLSIDRIGSQRPEPLASGALDQVRTLARNHVAP